MGMKTTVIRQQGNTIGFLADHLNLGTTFMLFTSFVFILIAAGALVKLPALIILTTKQKAKFSLKTFS